MRKVCLLSGGPGVGKTTVIRQALSNLRGKAGGFYTEEIRVGGVRHGFRLVTLEGESAILAHIDIKSPHRVSKYGVDIEGLDRVGVSALRQAIQECDLVVVDEIGKMELFSPAFRESVLEAINSGKRVLGTIMLSPHPWANDIKRHPSVTLISLTRANRNQVLKQVVEWVQSDIMSRGQVEQDSAKKLSRQQG